MLTQAGTKPTPLTRLSEEEELFNSTVRRFAEETIAPLVRTMDDEQQQYQHNARNSHLSLLISCRPDKRRIGQDNALTRISHQVSKRSGADGHGCRTPEQQLM